MNQLADNKKMGISNILQLTYKYGVYFIFFVMFVVFSFSNKNFLSSHNLLLILQQASPLALGVIGMTFVLITAGIDISAGQTMFLSATVVATYLVKIQEFPISQTVWGMLLAYVVALSVGALMGATNGLLVAKFKIVPFIATLVTTNIARGVGLLISNSEVIYVSEYGLNHVNNLIFGIPLVVIIAVALFILFDYLLRWTPYGRRIMAIGNDVKAAKNIGINVEKNVFFAYFICGILSGLAGILSGGQVGAIAANFAYGNEFIMIPAAVLGGTSLFGGKGSILPGALIGIILVTTIVNGMAMVSADPYMYQIVRGVIIFLAVMVDSVNYKGELR